MTLPACGQQPGPPMTNHDKDHDMTSNDKGENR